MKRRSIFVVAALAVAAGSFATDRANAGSPAECAPTESIDKYRLLRQLSLDLVDRIPTIEEYHALDSLDAVDAATIEALLTSEEYFAQVRGYHRSLIWAGLEEALDAVSGQRRLRRVGATNTWRLSNLRRFFRGRNNVECLNQLQTQFDANGYPIPINTFSDPTCDNDTCIQEGFVMVDPFWDPGNPVKVCAFDAQALAVGQNGQACGPNTIIQGCGCGPNLQYCLPQPADPTHQVVKRSLAEESTRIFEWVVRESHSYFEAFTTDTTFVNGPLVHFYTYLTEAALQNNGGVGFETRVTDLPPIPFSDADTWMPVQRGDVHAGVLTTPGFHLRFASNRSRVNQFYTAFRCEPFLPSADGLPAETEEIPNPNLRERAGCDACHATIEVAAAHWGRWRTNGHYGYIAQQDVDYDTPRAQCLGCDGVTKNCNAFCNRYFVTQQNAAHPDEIDQWEGYPLAREWLSAQEAEMIGYGPAELVATDADRDKIATCTVRTLAERLFGRELTDTESLTWLPQITAEFAASGHNFTDLVRTLIASETYRTIR